MEDGYIGAKGAGRDEAARAAFTAAALWSYEVATGLRRAVCLEAIAVVQIGIDWAHRIGEEQRGSTVLAPPWQ